jgi:putative drug exporter of the RND superfamily
MRAVRAHFVVRHRRLIVLAAVAFMVIAGAFGGSVAKHLSSGGFDDPNAESTIARHLAETTFGGGSPNIVLLVTAADGSADSAASVAAGQALTARLAAEPGVVGAASYWSTQAPPLKSTKGDKALVLARLTGTQNEVRTRIEELSPKYTAHDGAAPLSVTVTGEAEVFRQVGSTIESDLARAEAIALPITLLLLILVFGGLVAAALPLLIGGLTVLGTFLVLEVINRFTEVSIFALNLTTAMGLGLAIDYALFIVSRYREELAAGWSVDDAISRTVRTAGRTVVFSAATVGISLSALLVFNQSFLRSFAYAGVAVAAIAAIAAVVVLPAVLSLLGHRVNSLRILGRRREPRTAVAEHGTWHRIAMFVMKRPGRIAVAGTAALLLLGAPFLHTKLSLSDHRVLPTNATARVALDSMATEFGSRESSAAEVIIGNFSPDRTTELTTYATALSNVPEVGRVDTFVGSFIGGQLVAPADATSARFQATGATWLAVVPNVEAVSPAGERMVKHIRVTTSPFDNVRVGGPSAQLVDTKASLFHRLPYAALIIAAVTFILLFLMFGGLLVPLKALLLNMLSLSATFGAMVWIFQQGHLASTLNFTATGALDATTPILMFCIAFGLSMDYEVFLLSRIKEEHDRTGDNTKAVAMGLEHTGRIVTAAALLIALVFIAFATSGITFIKLFGLGLALAVLIDAFVIRTLLVPAFMRLAGEANWWAPAPLRRVQQRIGLSEHVELPDAPPVETGATGQTTTVTAGIGD